MPAPLEIRGRPASPGVAAGPIARLGAVLTRRRATGDAEGETRLLHAAIAAASAQIGRLTVEAEGDGAAILEFQSAMLADDELVAPAVAAIAGGDGAEAAWEAALGLQIAIYADAEDEYFRARAADLTDLRDRVLRNLSGVAADALPRGAIVTGEDITPTRFLETDWSAGGGIALAGGSAASHVAMLARSRGVPMVVGLGPFDLDGHAEAFIDGERGTILFSPGEAERAAFESRRSALQDRSLRAASFAREPAHTADGALIRVMVNIARPDEVESLDVSTCDGVGLMRTEFLFGSTLPDEDAQFAAYIKVLDWAEDRPVTIRTVDAGGDKPVAGLTIDEANPFLGLRGIRLSLARPEIFRVQLRALCRAATRGNLKVMFPMVTVPSEFAAASALVDRALAELVAEGVPAAPPPLGIMVEVPAAAIAPEAFAAAAFFSIGSNDLTQYVTAAARDSAHVADLNDPANPAVMRLIANVAECGAQSGREVSLCGDAAGSPEYVPALLRAGLRSLSAAPPFVALVKAAIAECSLEPAG